MIHPEDRQSVAQAVEALSSTSGTPSIVNDFRVLRKDGQVRWLQTHAERRVDPTTGKTTLFGTSLDITDRKALEGELHIAGPRRLAIFHRRHTHEKR